MLVKSLQLALKPNASATGSATATGVSSTTATGAATGVLQQVPVPRPVIQPHNNSNASKIAISQVQKL